MQVATDFKQMTSCANQIKISNKLMLSDLSMVYMHDLSHPVYQKNGNEQIGVKLHNRETKITSSLPEKCNLKEVYYNLAPYLVYQKNLID